MATDVGHLLLVDLCLDDLSCSQNEIEASGKVAVYRFEFRNKKICVLNSVYSTLRMLVCSHEY